MENKRNFVFQLLVGKDEEYLLSAPNYEKYEEWLNTLQSLIDEANIDSGRFKIE